jgi:hypothetical protein
VPGEKLCERTLSQIDTLRSSGCEIYTLRNPTVSARELAVQAAATGSVPATADHLTVENRTSPARTTEQLAGAAAAVSAPATTAATVTAAATAVATG